MTRDASHESAAVLSGVSFTAAQGDRSGQGASAPPGRPFVALPHAFGAPVLQARLRVTPADFQVDEMLAFGPDGEGEHALLRVRKASANTDWAARRLAVLAGVSHKAVGYAGLKDRHAVTTQWFSVHLGRLPEPKWQLLTEDGLEVLESHRHRRKLKRGNLAGNQFQIRLRELRGDLGSAEERLKIIARIGVPNYFGPQRFGRDGSNLLRAKALFAGAVPRASRHQRGLWLSAARSQLFNEVLAQRVERGDWAVALVGDRLQLRGTHSHFLAEVLDANIRERIDSGDLTPTGPLYGAGELPSSGEVRELEQRFADACSDWIKGLAEAGLKQERRALRMHAEGLTLERVGASEAVLRFTLEPGSYATTLIRELCDVTEGPGTG